MVVCKFFLQGNCRYGDRCWNEHPRDQGQGGWRQNQNNYFAGGTNYGQQGQNRFAALANQGRGGSGGGTQKQASASFKDLSPQELMGTIIQDMEVWDTGKMWPFSCYSMYKEAPCLPGFTDLSPEELRLEAYQAQASGNVAPYLQKVGQLSDEYKAKRIELKRNDQATKQKIMQEVMNLKMQYSSGSSQPTGTGGLFGSSSGTSVFGGTTSNNNNVFGAVSPNVNPFGVSSSSTPSQGLFGSQSPQTGQNLFGSPQPNNQPQPSVFGNQTTPVNTGLFGNAANTTPFGNPLPSQNQQQQQGIFSNNTTPGNVGLFGKPATQASSTSVFGSPANQTSATQGLFGKPAQPPSGATNVFGGSSSVFGGNQQNVAPTMPNQSGFGVASGQMQQQQQLQQQQLQQQQLQQQQTTGFGTAQSAASVPTPVAAATSGTVSNGVKSPNYTPLNELTEEEKQQFSSPTFTLGQIPTRPPPIELI